MFDKIGLAMMEGRKKNESFSLLPTSSRRLNRINLEGDDFNKAETVHHQMFPSSFPKNLCYIGMEI